MKRIIFTIILSFSLSTVIAQGNIQEVLRSIDANNSTLKALKEKSNADKIGNRIGINMANPEIEVGRLWASPRGNGSETDISITQSFDFPTAYHYRSQLSKEKDKQVDLMYQQEFIDIMQQARLLCIDLIYQNKLNKELTDRLKYARELSDGYQKMFDNGDIDILERNKTRLNLLNTEKALQINEVEISALKSELERLNGGLPIIIVLDEYSDYALPLNFDEWFVSIKGNNPTLQQAEQEIMLSRKQEQLTRAMNLPKFSAGYSNERVSGVTSQGFLLGLSIPLWEGRNTVKHQKAQTVAIQMQYDDSQFQFMNNIRKQYNKASILFVLLQEYQMTLDVTNNYELLNKAFDKGQLSLVNYLLELSVYYETIDKYLETERDYQLAVSELERWEQ